jgi:uncharacterized membrane protein YdjX (TVP38/TMEM64 family)
MPQPALSARSHRTTRFAPIQASGWVPDTIRVTPEQLRNPLVVAILAITALTAVATVSIAYTPLGQSFSAQGIVEWARQARGSLWPAVALTAAYVPASIVMVPPRPLITLAAVLAYGAWTGFAIAMIGVQVPSLLGYFGGRLFDTRTVERLSGPGFDRVAYVLRNRGVVAFTALRLVPVAPFMVASMIAGALRVPAWQVVVGTFLGMLPGVLGATVLGREAAAALESGEWSGWLVAAVLGGLALLAYASHAWLKRVSARMG